MKKRASEVDPHSTKKKTTSSGDKKSLLASFVEAGIPESDAKKYEQQFIDNDIDEEILPMVTYDILGKLDIKLGHQMRIMKVISQFRGPQDVSLLVPGPSPAPTTTSSPKKASSRSLDDAVQKEVSRAIRSAFQKEPRRKGSNNQDLYRLDQVLVREEIKKGKDLLFVQKNAHECLQILEAITKEYVNFGTGVGEANIADYGPLLDELAASWLDVFLSRDCVIEIKERSAWESKFLSWDKSPNPDQGTFTSVRFAVRHGWDNPLLVKVMKEGVLAEGEQFKEPVHLVVARLNMLKAENNPKAALNLAKVSELHHHVAMFHLDLGQVPEALEVVLNQVTEPGAAFTVAQVAKPLDIKAAFSMGMRCFQLTDDDAWMPADSNRATWLCELAISQKLGPELQSSFTKVMKSKVRQFEICKILQQQKEKEGKQVALDFALSCLRPYDPQLIKKLNEEKEARKAKKENRPINPEPFFLDYEVPKKLGLWIWTLASEMQIMEILDRPGLLRTLVLVLEHVTDVGELLEISQQMKSKSEFSLIIEVGEKCNSLIEKQQQADLKLKEERIRNQFEINLLLQEQQQLLLQKKTLPADKQKRLTDLQQLELKPAVFNLSFNNEFDNLRFRNVTLMLEAALDSEISLVPEKVMKKEEVHRIVEFCSDSIKNVPHMVQLTDTMRVRGKHHLILKVGNKVFQTVSELVKKFEERKKVASQITTLETEQQKLLLERKDLTPKQKTELNDLKLRNRLNELLPSYAIQDISTYEGHNFQVARSMIAAAVEIKNEQNVELLRLDKHSPKEEKRLEAQLSEVVLSCFAQVKNPRQVLQLVELLAQKDCYFNAHELITKVAERVRQMKKELDKRQVLSCEFNLWQQESFRLQRLRIKLSDENQKLFDELTERQTQQPPLPSWHPSGSPDFDELIYSIGSQLVNALFQLKSKTESEIQKNLQLTQEQIDKKRSEISKEMERVAEFCFKDLVQNPQHMNRIASDYFVKEYKMMMKIGDVILNRISQIQKELELREPSNKRRVELETERNELAAFEKDIAAPKNKELMELRLTYDIFNAQHTYGLWTDHIFANHILTISKAMLQAALQKNEQLESEIENNPKLTPEYILAERTSLKKEFENIQSLCLKYLLNPADAVSIVSMINSQSRKFLLVSYLLPFSFKAIELINNIRELRKVREPVQRRLDAMVKEIQHLKYSKKPFNEEQQKADQIKKELDALPKWPWFANVYSYEEHDHTESEVFRISLGFILEAKFEYERKIGSLFEGSLTPQLKKEIKEIKGKLKKSLKEVTSFITEHVTNPQILNTLAAQMSDRRMTELAISITKHLQTRVKEIQSLREVRQPIQTKIDQLLWAESQLQAQRKKPLPAEQKKQLENLEDDLKALPEWPYYAGLNDPNSYHNFANAAHSATLRSALQVKRDFEEKERMMIESKDPRLDLKKNAAKRSKIDFVLKTAVNLALEDIEDPLQLHGYLSNLGDQLDYLFDFAAKTQKNIANLEELVAKHAPLHKQITALENEEHGDDPLQPWIKKKLPAHKQTQLDDLRAQVAKLPKLPFFAKLNATQFDYATLSVGETLCNSVFGAIARVENDLKALLETPGKVDAEAQKRLQKKKEDLLQRVTVLVNKFIKPHIKNPQHLLTCTLTAETHAQSDILLELGEVTNLRVQALEKLREQRAPLQAKINRLLQEEQQLQRDFKKGLPSEKQRELLVLQEKAASLPEWPHYANLFYYSEFDSVSSSIARAQINVLLNGLATFVSQQNPASLVNDKKVKAEKEVFEGKIDKAVQSFLAFTEHPNFLKQFVTFVAPKNSARLLLVADKAFKRILEVEKMRQEVDHVSVYIQVLEAQKKEMEGLKKQLPPVLAQKLEELKSTQENSFRPHYISSGQAHDDFINELASEVIAQVTNNNETETAELSSSEANGFISADEVKRRKLLLRESLRKAVDLALKYVQNPEHMSEFVEEFGEEIEFALEFGKKIRETIITLSGQKRAFDLKMEKYNELKEEKLELQERRKQLPSDKLAELLKLEVEIKLQGHLPSFRSCSQKELDEFNTGFVLPVVEKLIEKKQSFEEEAMIREDLSEEEKEAERKKWKDALDEFVIVSLGHITDVPNLINLASALAEKENNLVITVAEVCEKQIEKLKQDLEKREELAAQLAEIESQVKIQKDGPTKQQEQQIEAIEKQQKELPEQYDDLPTLENYLLRITRLAIAAARVESNDRVLREQTSLAFKTSPSVEHWTQVKNLTSDLEWEDVKKELVVHVLDLSTNPEDKDFMDGLVKIELLLSEGMWQHALNLFPKPSGSDKELVLLTQLWVEVEKNSPKDLEKVKPLVERYVKRYFQEFKYNLVDPLLDEVQRKHPDFISEAYEKGIDFMMINLLPSQYPSLIRFLRAFRGRLYNLGRATHWAAFLESFQKKHKTKKKLLTMVGMLNDSSWNIFLNPATKEDKKTAAVVAAAEATKVNLAKQQKEASDKKSIKRVPQGKSLRKTESVETTPSKGVKKVVPSKVSKKEVKKPVKKGFIKKERVVEEDDEFVMDEEELEEEAGSGGDESEDVDEDDGLSSGNETEENEDDDE